MRARTTARAKTRPTPPAPSRRRLPPAERSQRILDEATIFFAEHGLKESTRALANRLGVAQALIYRYFPSKQALIERVIDHVFGQLWDDSWSALIADRNVPLAERLARLYGAYLDRAGPVAIRLFLRLSLEGSDITRRYSIPLTEQILRPVIAELRAKAGLPAFEARPMMRGERELAMILHGGMIFLGIRKHVYRTTSVDLTDLIGLQVATFLDGAWGHLTALHGQGATDSLTVEHLQRARRRR